MAKQNLLEIEPHKVKPGVDGKIFLVHGEKKVGKSTFASQFPDAIMLATEPGFNMLDGVHAVMVNSWIEMKDYAKQLKSDELKAKYKTVVIDTIGIAWDLAAKFIWIQKGQGDLEDYSSGLKQNSVSSEFSSLINGIAAEGYTVVMIGHSTRKDFPDEIGRKIYQSITIELPKRAKMFVTALADLTIFACSEPGPDGVNRPVMYLRAGEYDSGLKIEDAGGRYDTLPAKLPFTYNAFVTAIKEFDENKISAGVELSGKSTILENIAKVDVNLSPVWSDVIKEVNSVLSIISERANKGELELPKKAKQIIASYLGEGNKITEATPAQQELIEATLIELNALVAE